MSLLSKPKVDQVLRALHAQGEMNMTQFTKAAKLNPFYARQLLDHLVEYDVVTVEELPWSGKVGHLRISLSETGAQVVQHLLAIHDASEKARAALLEELPREAEERN